MSASIVMVKAIEFGSEDMVLLGWYLENIVGKRGSFKVSKRQAVQMLIHSFIEETVVPQCTDEGLVLTWRLRYG